MEQVTMVIAMVTTIKVINVPGLPIMSPNTDAILSGSAPTKVPVTMR